MKAFCFRSGQIGFARRLPRGAICLADYPADQACFARSAISALARHAYDGETLLVPGLPEASGEAEAFAALEHFQERVTSHLAKMSEAAHA